MTFETDKFAGNQNINFKFKFHLMISNKNFRKF